MRVQFSWVVQSLRHLASSKATAVAVVAVLLTPIFAGTVSPIVVYAAGETYAFTSSGLIVGKGGGYGSGNGVTFKKGSGQNSNIFIGSSGTAGWVIRGDSIKKRATGGYDAQLAGNAFGVTEGAIVIDDPNGVGPDGGSPPPGSPAAGGGNGAATEEKATCEGNGGLAWFVCPIIKTLDEVISVVDNQIISMLTVDRIYDDKGGSLKKVWGVMRNIALLMLIPAMLLMVIGTALDFGPFDPYTVKRALPRMLAAVIFISLSWWICTFLIDMSDVVGAGVLNLITGISGAQGKISLASMLGSGDDAAIFVSMAAGSYVAYGLGQISFGIIFSLALGAAMGLLMGYLTLVVRLLMILGLLVFSPIFALGWIFPGNDKLWKFWKGSFISLLLLFPIITGIIGLGRVGAYIVSQM